MPKRANPEIVFGGGGFDHCEAHDITNGIVTYPQLSSGGYFTLHRTYTSVDTPGFRSLKKRQLPDHPYAMHLRKFVASEGHLLRYRRHWTGSFGSPWQESTATNAFVMFPWMPPTAHLEQAMDKADDKLRKKASGMRANLAQLFAERQKTAAMLVSTVARVATAARALKRGHLGDFVTALNLGKHKTYRFKTGHGWTNAHWDRAMKTPAEQRLASHWLEFKYGWMPLLQDAKGAAELFAYHVSHDSYHDHFSTSAEAESKIDDYEVEFDATGTSYPVARYQFDTLTRARIKAYYRMDNPARQVLAQTGISNPALLAWEIIPFSFVVDWFYPLGTYLENLTAFDGFDYVGGTRSWLTKSGFSKYGHTSPPYAEDQWGSYMKYQSWSGAWSRQETIYHRELVYSWPSNPVPHFRSPLGNNYVDRFATAFALLQQVFGRK